MSTCKKDSSRVITSTTVNTNFKEPNRPKKLITDAESKKHNLFTPESFGAACRMAGSKQYSVRSSLILTNESNSNDNNSAMDRFIPCRMRENLQSKFEAVS